jgi:poly(A) polymerase
VDRSDFFTSFYKMLQENKDVTDLTQIPDAYVPVMKFQYLGISIDLVFARLILPTIPEELDLLDHNLLRMLDEKCVVSLNGSRTTDEILRLVPNIETFHMALRCIKFWAKRRGLYNNAMGYVGGVACALLTARICQLYPNAAASTIVTRFFKIYHQWKWAQPVMLKTIEDYPLGLRVWNPRTNPSDRYHRMPVITPAYPSMCSTHNVSQSTLDLMREEFKRGSEVMLRIEQKKASWTDLFAKSDFFCRYKHFFQIIAVANSEEAHRMWSGFVESKIRILVGRLEGEEYINGAPPFPETFDLPVKGATDEEIYKAHFYVEDEEMKVDEDAAKIGTEGTTYGSYTTCYYIALSVAPPDPSNKGPRRLILDRPVNDFSFFTNTWDKKTDEMRLLIRDIKRDNLPSYLFTDVPRPAKVKRPKKTMSPPAMDGGVSDSNGAGNGLKDCMGKRSRTFAEVAEAGDVSESGVSTPTVISAQP